MSVIRLNARLAKIEDARRTARQDRFFMVWGRDDAAAVNAVRAAYQRGDFGKGDPVIFAGWQRGGQLPEPRWTTVHDISDDELSALIAALPSEEAKASDAEQRKIAAMTCTELMMEIADCFQEGVATITGTARA